MKLQSALSLALALASGYGGYRYGVWTEQQSAPAYRAAILSQTACVQQIEAAVQAVPRLVSDDPLLSGIIAMQTDQRRASDDVLDFCAEVWSWEDDNERARFRR